MQQWWGRKTQQMLFVAQIGMKAEKELIISRKGRAAADHDRKEMECKRPCLEKGRKKQQLIIEWRQ